MKLEFNGKEIKVMANGENNVMTGEDAFDPAFKNLILGISLLLRKESENIIAEMQKTDLSISFKNFMYYDSMVSVLVSFEKVFVDLPTYNCLVNSKFTLEEVSSIYTAIHLYCTEVRKKFAKLVKDLVPEAQKKINAETKDMIKYNNDWYLVAVGVLKEKDETETV